MKKILLFLILLISIPSFSQSTNWGTWSTSDCFKGISFRVRVKDYNDAAKKYTWEYEIKNSYNQKVALNYDIVNSSLDGRVTIPAGGVNRSWCLHPSNTQLYFAFSNLCFHFPNGFDQCSNYPGKNYAGYAECDNGTPKYVKSGENLSSSLNNTNSNLNEQNQNEIQSKTDTYMAYYQKATNAGKAGNYDEAISLWKSAIAVAVNDEQRSNATAWLAKVENAKANNNSQINRPVQNNTQLQQTYPNSNSQYNNSNSEALSNISNLVTTSMPLMLKSIEEVQKFKIEERELYNKLRGNEGLYPEATNYYNEYLKYKKKAKNVRWIGSGISVVGFVILGASINKIAYSDNLSQFYTGLGVTLGGVGITLGGIPASFKSKAYFDKAKNMVAYVGLKSNGLSLAIKF